MPRVRRGPSYNAKGARQPPPSLRPMSAVGTVAHLSYCWALVALLTVVCPISLQCAAAFSSQKIAHSPSRTGSPLQHMVRTAYWVIMPNNMSIGSAVLYGSQVLHSASPMGKKTAKTARFPWDFVTLPEEDRSTGHGHMQHVQIARAVPDISSRADRHTQTCSSQYFATALAGEVKYHMWIEQRSPFLWWSLVKGIRVTRTQKRAIGFNSFRLTLMYVNVFKFST